MPTYQYECGSCGHEFEILQAFSAKKLKKCPKCGKSTLHRLIGTGGGLIFKGTGFYETDYKKSKPSAAPKKDKESKHSGTPCGDSCACASANTAKKDVKA